MPLPLDPNRPIYHQLMEEIKRRAVRGIYPPGAQLPSVRDFARETGVNPNTVARVYLELEREGFITTRRGQGTYLTDDPARIGRERTLLARDAVERFIGEMRGLGLDNGAIEGIRERLENTFEIPKAAL
ncbi:MAG: GntR family transcriptional regulator [Candidatus Latescibacterota bacterium]